MGQSKKVRKKDLRSCNQSTKQIILQNKSKIRIRAIQKYQNKMINLPLSFARVKKWNITQWTRVTLRPLSSLKISSKKVSPVTMSFQASSIGPMAFQERRGCQKAVISLKQGWSTQINWKWLNQSTNQRRPPTFTKPKRIEHQTPWSLYHHQRRLTSLTTLDSCPHKF